MVVDHVFPADGEYAFEVTFTTGDNSRFEDIDISIDGQRVALVAYENWSADRGADGSGQTPLLHRADARQGRPAQGRRGVRQDASTVRTKI